MVKFRNNDTLLIYALTSIFIHISQHIMRYDYLPMPKSDHSFAREKHFSVVRRFIHISVTTNFVLWSEFRWHLQGNIPRSYDVSTLSGNLHAHCTPLLFSNLTCDRHAPRKLSLHKIINHVKQDWKTKNNTNTTENKMLAILKMWMHLNFNQYATIHFTMVKINRIVLNVSWCL